MSLKYKLIKRIYESNILSLEDKISIIKELKNTSEKQILDQFISPEKAIKLGKALGGYKRRIGTMHGKIPIKKAREILGDRGI